jgi:glutamine synthetase
MIIHIDYVWVDGLESPLVRSKTRVEDVFLDENGKFDLPISEWNFDGSSTCQATTSDSERLLVPKRVYQLSETHYTVLCEVCIPDDKKTPHETNHRYNLRTVIEEVGDTGLWVGFEQEYFLTKAGKNVLWPKDGLPINDTRYYCSSGGPIKHRHLVREHAALCNKVGIKVVGYNTEVSPGQWEYQVFAKDALQACDDLWMSRYLLQIMAETQDVGVEWAPKPYAGWNGSGCHTNFSTTKMRDEGTEGLFISIMEKASNSHISDMLRYGSNNESRMTGLHETSSYDKFSYGIASRNTSIRIPTATVQSEWKGYAEDRRPASNCDPYRVVASVYSFSA